MYSAGKPPWGWRGGHGQTESSTSFPPRTGAPSGWISDSPPTRCQALMPGTCECSLIWRKGLCGCDEANGLSLGRLTWIIQVGPECHDRCPQKRVQRRRRGPCDQEAETGAMRPQTSRWKRQGIAPPPPSLGEPGPADIPIWAGWYWSWSSGVQKRQRVHFCCFKPPALWSFVPAAPGPRSRRGGCRTRAYGPWCPQRTAGGIAGSLLNSKWGDKCRVILEVSQSPVVSDFHSV